MNFSKFFGRSKTQATELIFEILQKISENTEICKSSVKCTKNEYSMD